MPEHASAQAIANKCKAFVREIREDDFSLTSGDVCGPAQTSGVKNNASALFFTLFTEPAAFQNAAPAGIVS